MGHGMCICLAEFRRPQTTESNEVRFFRRHVRRKKLCSGRKRASRGPNKPNKVGLFGGGGARKWSDAWPSGRDERCGLCPDEVRCSGLHPFEKMLAFLREPVSFFEAGPFRYFWDSDGI